MCVGYLLEKLGPSLVVVLVPLPSPHTDSPLPRPGSTISVPGHLDPRGYTPLSYLSSVGMFVLVFEEAIIEERTVTGIFGDLRRHHE